MLVTAFSPFPTMFSKGFLLKVGIVWKRVKEIHSDSHYKSNLSLPGEDDNNPRINPTNKYLKVFLSMFYFFSYQLYSTIYPKFSVESLLGCGYDFYGTHKDSVVNVLLQEASCKLFLLYSFKCMYF